MENDEHDIRRVVDTWLTASKAGDLGTLLNLMADDVVFMVSGRESFGKDAFAASSRQMIGMRFDATSDIQEIEVHGDVAWMRNHLTVTVTPPDAAPVTRAGYTLTILRKMSDGSWVIARDANLLTVKA
ncbi:MAG TPA: SgcJ/EcaC family oxidoreductase [Alphaproteobacteria bacterium]